MLRSLVRLRLGGYCPSSFLVGRDILELKESSMPGTISLGLNFLTLIFGGRTNKEVGWRLSTSAFVT